MPRKKDTPYDFIKWRCSDLNYCAEEIDSFKKKYKKGKVDLKELTEIKRTIVFCSKNIKEALDRIEKIYQKLN